MINWISIKDDFPNKDQNVLLYWKRSGHVEDGRLFTLKSGAVGHILFDGECLNDTPTHWAEFKGPDA